MAYEENYKMPEIPQNIILESRRKLSVSAVKDVESFDEEMVVLHTTRGTLVVRGQGLHLQLLSLDGGQVHVDGTVNSMTYEDSGREAAGFFARLFG